MKQTTLTLFLLLLVLASCSSPKANAWLEKALQLVEEQPDLALACLDSIELPSQNLSAEGYRQYTIAKVQAMYLLDMDISLEDEIFETRDYYDLHGKDYGLRARASLGSGHVLEACAKKEDAMQAYKQAFDDARLAQDSLLMGRAQQYMGRLLAHQNTHEAASAAYRKAAGYYHAYPQRQTRCYEKLGNQFLLLHAHDSALYYYQKGLDLAKRTNDTSAYCSMLLNMGVAYRKVGDYALSEQFLKQSLALNHDSTETARYHLCLAKLYLEMDASDSCACYSQLLKEALPSLRDDYLLASAYAFLAKKAKREHDMDTAYLYLNLSKDKQLEIKEERQKQSIYEAQQRYDFEKEQNQLNEQLINQQQWIFVILSVLALAMLAIALISRRALLQKKNKEALQVQMMRMDQEIIELMRQVEKTRGYQLQGNNLRKHLESRLEIVFSIAAKEQDEALRSDPMFIKTKRMIYGAEDKSLNEAVFDIFREAFPEYEEKIPARWPSLNATELRVCILSFMPLSVKQVAAIIGQTEHTVGKARTNIRKKLGMEEKNGDFCEEIMRQLGR